MTLHGYRFDCHAHPGSLHGTLKAPFLWLISSGEAEDETDGPGSRGTPRTQRLSSLATCILYFGSPIVFTIPVCFTTGFHNRSGVNVIKQDLLILWHWFFLYTSELCRLIIGGISLNHAAFLSVRNIFLFWRLIFLAVPRFTGGQMVIVRRSNQTMPLISMDQLHHQMDVSSPTKTHQPTENSNWAGAVHGTFSWFFAEPLKLC